MNSDLYTAIDIYFLYNDNATMEKWNSLSIEEQVYYNNIAIRENHRYD